MESTKRLMVKVLDRYRLYIDPRTAATFIKEDKDLLPMWKESSNLDDFKDRVYQSDKRYCGAAMYIFKCDPYNLDHFGEEFAYIKNVEVKTLGDKYLYIGNDNCKMELQCGDRAKVSVFYQYHARKICNLYDFVCYIKGRNIGFYTNNWDHDRSFVPIGDGLFAIFQNYNRFAIYQQSDLIR